MTDAEIIIRLATGIHGWKVESSMSAPNSLYIEIHHLGSRFWEPGQKGGYYWNPLDSWSDVMELQAAIPERLGPKARRAVTQGPRGYQLRKGKSILAVVAVLGKSPNGPWYWYGMGRNTAPIPIATADEAKAQAMEWVKSQLAVPHA